MKRIINKIRLLFKSLNVIGNINELIVKMHNLERDLNNTIYQYDIKLEKRIDENYDILYDRIEEEGKLFDSLEAMQRVNKDSIETLSRGLMDIKKRELEAQNYLDDNIIKLEDKIIKIESCDEIGTQLIESLLNKVETLESNHINLSNKGGVNND